MSLAPFAVRCDVPPYRLSGTVVAALLNHRDSLAALGDAVLAPPYRGAPKAVVLAIKPRHALVAAGDALLVDDAAAELAVGASLGIVIARTACAVRAANALSHVAGYLVACDATVPHASHYRPQIRAMARDASCAFAAAVVARDAVGDAGALAVRTFVDGELAVATSSAELVRGVARLVADISDFMTLAPGDVVLAGSAPDAPRVRAGTRVAVEIECVGRLETRVALADRAAA
ncbi:MAG TPA: fumarylacetoacetate hydrolase family protein [Caldimonas sp.]|nr:fumarylacetoacetate hydrolase family protein [Caldimonas sp.]